MTAAKRRALLPALQRMTGRDARGHLWVWHDRDDSEALTLATVVRVHNELHQAGSDHDHLPSRWAERGER